MNFADQRVLVTGGTRGIGRAIVEAFAKAGARVAFTYRSSGAAADEVRQTLQACGTQVLSFQSDVADTQAAEEVVRSILGAWGHIDVLVNNAGITRDNLLVRMREEDWDQVMDTNLKSIFNYTKAVYRSMMRRRSGRIINISSIVGLTGNPGQTNYAASKAGVIGYSKSLAKELGKRGVTVNVVAPGYVQTDMTETLSEKVREATVQQIPLQRIASPEEIAGPVLFLASSAANYITGQVLAVDGGLVM